MTVKDLLVLLNAPERNASAERALQQTQEALELALEQFGRALGPAQADELKKILRIALNLSRTKGIYEGLREGRRLHKFESRIEGNPALRYLTHRIRKFPKATGQGKDGELCKFMDKQIGRLRKLRTVSKYEMPLPLATWATESWVQALENCSSAVSKYISEARKMVLSDDYTFLLAWKRIAKSVPGGPRNSVDHRGLHMDKLYDRTRGKLTRPSP